MCTYEILSLIVTGLGVVATFSAVAVALWQPRHANKKKLKLKFLKNSTVVNPSTGDKKLYVGISISNVGNRKVIVTNWGVKLKNNAFLLILTSGFEKDYFDSVVSTETPVVLEPEESIAFYHSERSFKALLAEYIEKNELDKDEKITFWVHDSTGKTYKTKSTMKAKEYLQESA